MKLGEVIRADRVVVPLEVGTLREAAGALLDRLQATAAIANLQQSPTDLSPQVRGPS